VSLALATQRPDKDSLPTGVTANVATRLALRVRDQTTNDMILGTSAYKQGIRATMFGPSDKGVAYLRGAGEPVIVRGFYVDAVKAERCAIGHGR
jgi:DNA segregation ATPase FtsK/SpoIIIE, S-DNA-T family